MKCNCDTMLDGDKYAEINGQTNTIHLTASRRFKISLNYLLGCEFENLPE